MFFIVEIMDSMQRDLAGSENQEFINQPTHIPNGILYVLVAGLFTFNIVFLYKYKLWTVHCIIYSAILYKFLAQQETFSIILLL